MSGITRLIVGELAQAKTKGKEFISQLGKRLSPKAIAEYKCEEKDSKK